MKCAVLRSERRQETYLYVPLDDEGEPDLEQVPAALTDHLGRLETALAELDLAGRERLARADPKAVTEALAEKGYYLQTPPPITELMDRAGEVAGKGDE
ncbi:hypothetical protein SAMN05660831_01379 [Thiohalospira halophila DSM 15071]|uniref:YcgL domain-containing protein n=1 Tax=Thiohalospira halophila DSM 15071 TaxID=1123397 RepID=A0A1I1R9S0_9GAMM|nr:YcgL domain-containing protein [Thiohalospira halophila]SFD31081.1 hypothetical protein SAMN05660831_01379 [Thiohalospira halophila DSM 15071]